MKKPWSLAILFTLTAKCTHRQVIFNIVRRYPMRIPLLSAILLLTIAGCMIVPRPTEQELQALDNPPPAVQAKLQHFFPRVISWYAQVESELFPTGRPLSQRETDFAIRMGVKEPSRVRIVILEEFPLPADPELRTAAERMGMGSKTEVAGPTVTSSCSSLG